MQCWKRERDGESERKREREWERNKHAIVYIWHANGTVGNRDGDKIEKEAEQRGTHRLCSDTAGCLISDIDKSVNRERNSLPRAIYSSVHLKNMYHDEMYVCFLSDLHEENSLSFRRREEQTTIN